MRRTTISRSRRAHLAAVALALTLPAAPLASQQPQPNAPAPAAQQPAAAPAPSQTFATPATHTVAQGETLWGLAKQFLGDPLLWPEIYRLNTNVVEDPHWIFPGEELRFTPSPEQLAAAPAPAADTAAAKPPAPAGDITVSPTPADTVGPKPQPSPSGDPFAGPTIFSAKSSVTGGAATLRLQGEQAYRAVRPGEHYSAGFLTEGEQLNSGTLLGNTRTSSIASLSATTSAMLFSEVALTPPPGDSLKVGDMLLVYQTPRSIVGWGQVVLPTGLVKVTSLGGAGGNATGQVIAVYQSMTSGQFVIPIQPYKPGPARGVAVDSGIVGSVISLRDQHDLATEGDVVFIDKGADDSVHLGDVFQLSGTTTAASGIGEVVQNEVKAIVVYLRPRSSSAVIIQIDRPDVRAGDTARQIRRMPS